MTQQRRRMKTKLLWMTTLTALLILPWLYGQTMNMPQVENKLVCMSNNRYMGTDQIPTEVGGKTYYGCCQGCAGALKNNAALRRARDPYSGEEVDKAQAYIVVKSNETKEVYYFKSRDTFNQFQKTMNYLLTKGERT